LGKVSGMFYIALEEMQNLERPVFETSPLLYVITAVMGASKN